MSNDLRKRDDVVQILRRVGYPDVAEAAAHSLADPVDIEEVIRFLAPYGITYSVLTDHMGGST